MNNILGYDCDGTPIYEYRILRGIWTNAIDISKLPNTDPRIYCAIYGNDNKAYAISVHDTWLEKEIRAMENLPEDEAIPTIIKPISEMINYEVSIERSSGVAKEWYYEFDREELKRKLNTLLKQLKVEDNTKQYVKKIDNA